MIDLFNLDIDITKKLKSYRKEEPTVQRRAISKIAMRSGNKKQKKFTNIVIVPNVEKPETDMISIIENQFSFRDQAKENTQISVEITPSKIATFEGSKTFDQSKKTETPDLASLTQNAGSLFNQGMLRGYKYGGTP